MATAPRDVRRPLVGVVACLAVVAGFVTPAEAAPTGSISGRVTSPSGRPVDGVDVEVFLRTSQGCDSCWESVSDAVGTDDDGTYLASGLAPGTYRLGFTSDAFQVEYFQDVHYFAGATDLELAAGQQRTGIDVRLDPGGELTGVVRDDAGTPVPDVRVSASNDENNVWRAQFTDAAGRYTLPGIPTGEFTVGVDDFGGTHTEPFTRRALVAPQRLTQDFTITRLARISGRVTGSAGQSSVNAALEVYRKDGVGASATWKPFEPPWRDSSGQGLFTVSVPAGSYRIAASTTQELGAPTFYGGSGDLSGATDIVVTTGKHLTGRDITLRPAGAVTGTITYPPGSPDYSTVELVDPTTGDVVDHSSTQARGTYRIVNVPPGTYAVQFARTPYDGLVGELYDDVPEASGVGAAATVTVEAGQVVTGVNATLAAGATLTGTVEHADGSPAPGCLVEAFDPTGVRSTRLGITETDGSFSVPGLSAGDYAVRTRPGNWPPSRDWTCVGEPDPNRDEDIGGYEHMPDPRFWTSPDGTLTGSDETLETVTVPSSGSVAVPTVLAFATGLPLSASPGPAVHGTAKVGATLTATPGTWNVPGLTYVYQWRSGSQDVGTNRAAYVPRPQDAGKQISVVVTARRTGYTSTSAASPASAAVAPPTVSLTSTAAPRATGTARVGRVLSADPGEWSLAGVSFRYQWRRNGVPVRGATRATYPVPATDLGARISVTVTASLPGTSAPASRTSAPSARIARGVLTVSGRTVFRGSSAVGGRLTVTAPNCTPRAVVSYQWLRGGRVVRGATRRTYAVGRVDKGRHLAVRITFRRTGFTTTATVVGVGRIG